MSVYFVIADASETCADTLFISMRKDHVKARLDSVTLKSWGAEQV